MVLHAQYHIGINNEVMIAPLEVEASLDHLRQPRSSGAIKYLKFTE
jgi:hypothetical protein